jgi:hypothetical protein
MKILFTAKTQRALRLFIKKSAKADFFDEKRFFLGVLCVFAVKKLN